MPRELRYDKHIRVRADTQIKDILKKFKERTGMGYSEMIRRVFLFFDSNFLTLIKILEESKENDKKKK